MKQILFHLSLGIIILTWSLVVPVFEFPDEQAHAINPEFILTQARMPGAKEYDLTSEMMQAEKLLGTFRSAQGTNQLTYHPEYRQDFSQDLTGPSEQTIINLNTEQARTTFLAKEGANYPPLYYYYLALWVRLVKNSDLFTRIYAMRLGSLLLVPLMSYVIWKMGKLLFGKNQLAQTLTLLVMLQPMFSFLTAGINSDNLHNALFTILLYGCLLIIYHGITGRVLLGLAVVITLDILTKPQGFIAIPLVVLSFLIRAAESKQWQTIRSLAVFLATIIILTIPEWNHYAKLLWTQNASGASLPEFIHFSLNKLVTQNSVWYWGVFKWLGVVLPAIYWRLANRVVLLAVVGLIVYGWKVIKGQSVPVKSSATIFLLLASTVYAAGIYWYDWQHTKINGYSLGIQARYFFPTITAHLALLTTGIVSFTSRKRINRWLRRGIILLFIYLQLGGIWTLLSSYYDLSSLHTLIIQMSQYKPWFAKGAWWYLWGGLYCAAMLYLIRATWSQREDHEN